jgi:hypothetical protein
VGVQPLDVKTELVSLLSRSGWVFLFTPDFHVPVWVAAMALVKRVKLAGLVDISGVPKTLPMHKESSFQFIDLTSAFPAHHHMALLTLGGVDELYLQCVSEQILDQC